MPLSHIYCKLKISSDTLKPKMLERLSMHYGNMAFHTENLGKVQMPL